MHIAILSDVHGNLSAFEAVLNEIERVGADMLVFAGDLCLFGPRPAECLRLLRDGRIASLRGNTDEWVVSQDAMHPQFQAALNWTAGQLIGEDLNWLGRLPFSLRVSPTEKAADDLLIVHANPHNVNDILYPPEDFQIARYGEIRQTDQALRDRLSGVEAAVLAFGHLHIPNVRSLGSITLVNVSSVSMPGDGDGRAKFAILKWDGSGWQATHHRVVYTGEVEAEAFRANRPPGWEEAVAALEKQGYYYPQKI